MDHAAEENFEAVSERLKSLPRKPQNLSPGKKKEWLAAAAPLNMRAGMKKKREEEEANYNAKHSDKLYSYPRKVRRTE